MSYLILKEGVPDFDKAVISFWFRFSKQEVLQVAGTATGRLQKVLPLLTFGKMFDGYQLINTNTHSGSYTKEFWGYNGATGAYTFITSEVHSPATNTPIYAAGAPLPADTSYIGILCDVDGDTGELTHDLQIRMQMKGYSHGSLVDVVNQVSISNHKVLSSWTNPTIGSPPALDTAWSYGFDRCLTDGVMAGGEMVSTQTNIDYTDVIQKQRGPDAFEAGGIDVEPDKWHHLLLSFDFSESSTATGGTIFDDYGECSPTPARSKVDPPGFSAACKMWVAVDDKNYDNTTFSLGPRQFASGSVLGLGKNGVGTYDQYEAASRYNGGMYQKAWSVTGLVSITQSPLAGTPSFTYVPSKVASAGQPFGIPCVPETVSHIYHHVELAEFQLFTNVTLDTGIEINRQAFVVKVDETFDPTTQEPVTVKKPAPPQAAEDLLGKRPEILLHRAGNWKRGKNTGSIGIDDRGDEIPEGQFEPTGEIKPYQPDPSLIDRGAQKSEPSLVETATAWARA